MPITKYNNQTFTGQTLKIEECHLVNCVLQDCTILFSGGLIEMVNTRLERCQWKFLDEAGRTCQILAMIGALPQNGLPNASFKASSGPVN